MTDAQHPQDEEESNEKNEAWERLYALKQSTTRGMMEEDKAYPVVHHIYEKRKHGSGQDKFYRLCDNRYWGDGHARVLDEPPFGCPPISVGWDNPSLLGDGYSCAECAEAAWEIVEMEAGGQEGPPETEFDPVRKNDVYLFGITSEAECYVVEAGSGMELLVGEVSINGMHISMKRGHYLETECHGYEIVDDGDRIDLLYQPDDPPSADSAPHDDTVREIPFEDAVRMLRGEADELMGVAREQLWENYKKKGDGWQYEDPRYHFWKGQDEFFSACDATKDGDLETMAKRIGDGWNHILMASYLAYSEEEK